MKTRTTSILILLMALQVHAQSLQPGLWKTKTSFKLNGVPLPASENEECVSAQDTKDAKASISDELKKNKCELTKWNVKGKNLEAGLKCDSDEIKANGELRGQFTKKNYNLQGEAKGTYQGVLPSTATVQLEGQWVRACDDSKKKE